MSVLNEKMNGLTVDKLKEQLNQKNYENIIKSTKNIVSTTEPVEDFFLKARLYALLQCEKYSQIIGEILYIIKKNNKQDIKSYFIENLPKFKTKNIFYEFFYSMYKLGQYKKLNIFLNHFVENENKKDYFINVLIGYVNYHLDNFEKCINVFESLLYDKDKQAFTTINVHSSYFSAYMKSLYEYNFMKRKKDDTSIDTKLKDIENIKEKIKNVTKSFKYDEKDKYEYLFNYAIFFTIEKNYQEALHLLDLTENKCRNELSEEESIIISNLDEIKNKEIREKLWNIEFQRAYLHSQMNELKEAVAIYEKLLMKYNNEEPGNINLISLSYNNYLALKYNTLYVNRNTVTSEEKENTAITSIFTISNEQLNEIKAFLFFKKNLCTQLNNINHRTFEINDCIASYMDGRKDEFQAKLNALSVKYGDSIIVDKLKIMLLKSEDNYVKCKIHIHNCINRVYSVEEKIQFINGFVSLCFEKKNYEDIIKIYEQQEGLFQNYPTHYSSLFSNMFYIYICTNYLDTAKDKTAERVTLNRVIELFDKYKTCVKKDIRIINYGTLFLVSEYFIYKRKTELLNDIFQFLSENVKNDIEFFAVISYLYTYINVNNAYIFEDKLKKAVLSETYLIDVEELENRNIAADIQRSMELNATKKEKTSKKRKRKKSKNPSAIKKSANYDPERWLPKHEKNSYKKKKKNAKKDTSATTGAAAKGIMENVKTTQNVNINVNEKLKNLKSRKRR